eukprot:CAMPEP_0197941512 /NCGR_PEP_ID=MMETSP1439-20131203/122904_1 /TAXON_ID=66791 /ORGANISM="Gonyaulax spinifera, Strain CCMP409" /LENGTH=36 /DNA_ID= /DNA_START= /DNA_END= /DNA_ORIENTATION=
MPLGAFLPSCGGDLESPAARRAQASSMWQRSPVRFH